MNLIGKVYNLPQIFATCRNSVKIIVIHPPKQKIGLGNLRILSVRNDKKPTEIVTAYEDYCR